MLILFAMLAVSSDPVLNQWATRKLGRTSAESLTGWMKTAYHALDKNTVETASLPTSYDGMSSAFHSISHVPRAFLEDDARMRSIVQGHVLTAAYYIRQHELDPALWILDLENIDTRAHNDIVDFRFVLKKGALPQKALL